MTRLASKTKMNLLNLLFASQAFDKNHDRTTIDIITKECIISNVMSRFTIAVNNLLQKITGGDISFF
jgi:hypothetical protein